MSRRAMLALVAALGFGMAGVAAPTASQAGVFVSVTVAPPPLPVYAQPPCPGYGYMWAPGYWAWDDDDDDYYWVPGTWVEPPHRGYLWTPGWWDSGWDGAYVWHEGYWGPTIGFYGGINYGFGYTGWGYEGAYWRGDRIYYNRTVNNITNINNTYIYNKTVINNTNVTRVSYNGGPGGVRAQPTWQQRMATPAFHTGPTQAQLQHVSLAQQATGLHASANHGLPPVAAVPRPASFRPTAIPEGGRGGGNFQPGNGRGFQPNGGRALEPSGSRGSFGPAPNARSNSYDSVRSAQPRGTAPSQPPGRTYQSQWQERQDWRGGGRSPQDYAPPPSARSYPQDHRSFQSTPPDYRRGASPYYGGGRSPQDYAPPPSTRSYPQDRRPSQSPAPGYQGGASPYYGGGREPQGYAPPRAFSPPAQFHDNPQAYRPMGGPGPTYRPMGGSPGGGRPSYAPPRSAPPQGRSDERRGRPPG